MLVGFHFWSLSGPPSGPFPSPPQAIRGYFQTPDRDLFGTVVLKLCHALKSPKKVFFLFFFFGGAFVFFKEVKFMNCFSGF